jgi:hypothetical protein
LPGFGSRRAARRALEGRAGAPYLFPALLSLLVLGLGWWFKDSLPALTGAAAAPEQQVRSALAELSSARLEDVYGHGSGGLAELQRLRFGDVTVAVDGERAQVVAMADGSGRVAWRGHEAALGYVGREAFTMRRCRFAGWCSEREALAELRPVLRLLFRRVDAFNGREAAAYGRLVAEGYQGEGGRAALLARLARDLGGGPAGALTVTGWQIRVERDEATVGEDERLSVDGAPPVTLRARFRLVREADRWVFADGL